MSLPPRATAPHGRTPRIRGSVLIAAGTAVAIGLALTGAWYVGLFTSDGRFTRLDACTLLPAPDALAPLVDHGAREPGNSRPRNWLGSSSGDTSSECKWSSVPAGRDRPFRTVRVRVETKIREGRTSAETRAERALITARRAASRSHGTPVTPLAVGAGGYTVVDETTIRFVVYNADIYDVHARFRVSNALVDVSARTHSRPAEEEKALVVRLARNIAGRLA